MNETPNGTGQGSGNRPARRPDNRQFAPATGRNRDAILAVLERVLPETGLMLEIGAGSGEHAAWFAPRFPGLVWQPTEPDPDGRASITAWVEAANVPNLRPPLDLDVTAAVWPVEQEAGTAAGVFGGHPRPPRRTGTKQEAGTGSARTGTQKFDAVFSANMIHIAPWQCCLGLMAGAGRILGPGGVLVLYGPFKRDGEPTAPSNADFDAGLKNHDPAWGVRDLGDVTEAALDNGLALEETVAMPANNLMAIFRR